MRREDHKRGSSEVDAPYRYTGQRWEENDALDIYYYKARWYDPALGRFLQPDTIVPSAANPQALNRYAYSLDNPLKYVDSSGRFAWIPVILGASKLLDWGWTAWDTYQSGRTLANPDATRSEKLMAGLNIALAVSCEAIEPDDLFPAGLPADDIARKALMKGAKEAYQEGGEEALEKFVRKSLGDQADEVLDYFRSGAKSVDDLPTKPLGRGNTGRTVPKNLTEQLAMEQAMSNPTIGTQLDVRMTDARWPMEEGWVKMSQNINDIEIHYVFNTITGAVDDFKFK